jgi:hypothetical protein
MHSSKATLSARDERSSSCVLRRHSASSRSTMSSPATRFWCVGHPWGSTAAFRVPFPAGVYHAPGRSGLTVRSFCDACGQVCTDQLDPVIKIEPGDLLRVRLRQLRAKRKARSDAAVRRRSGASCYRRGVNGTGSGERLSVSNVVTDRRRVAAAEKNHGSRSHRCMSAFLNVRFVQDGNDLAVQSSSSFELAFSGGGKFMRIDETAEVPHRATPAEHTSRLPRLFPRSYLGRLAESSP